MDESAQKLLTLSKWTYCMLYAPLFGYTINQDLYFLWVAMLFAGGVLLLFKHRLIRQNMRNKITLIDLISILGLIYVVFSDINLRIFFRQVIFFVVVTIFIISYNKLLYAGKLT
ncbi:hypothetical protein RGU12_07795 [Fredinandcohnia sp. QZ13]|uniref:hypothetical protein n=1 Tax=Fredinandcohnia sp. QZ13 TaxID=3073144 RepID=UPI002852F749|nr:hypothetical protein [Fredinandcohnia sp. QZ13]MDR4887462.1 hypothetical protein [Fredinandcohnia sp. QZ13]